MRVSSTQAGAGLSAYGLAMPDLGLIKQVEQGCATGRGAAKSLCLGFRLCKDGEFAHPQDFLTTSFAGKKEKAETAMNGPNEFEH
jgi:hypothetical protein